MAQQLLHIRLESEVYDRVKAEADRLDISLAEFVRRSVEKALPGSHGASPAGTTTPAVDPVLQVISTSVQEEAASRGLSPAMIIELLFRMTRPTLPAGDESNARSLRTNLAAPGPTGAPKHETPETES
jgi:hypothetical protein